MYKRSTIHDSQYWLKIDTNKKAKKPNKQTSRLFLFDFEKYVFLITSDILIFSEDVKNITLPKQN